MNGKKLLAAMSAVMTAVSITPVPTLAEETQNFDWFLNASALPETWDMEQPIFIGITDATGCIPQVTIPAADADTKLNFAGFVVLFIEINCSFIL